VAAEVQVGEEPAPVVVLSLGGVSAQELESGALDASELSTNLLFGQDRSARHPKFI